MHIPGHHIPRPAGPRLRDPASRCLVVCHSGMRFHRAAQFLKQADFSASQLAGGTRAGTAGLPVVTGDTAQIDRVTEIVGPTDRAGGLSLRDRQPRNVGRTSRVKRSSCARWSSPMNRTQRSVTPASAYPWSAVITASAGPSPMVPRWSTPPP